MDPPRRHRFRATLTSLEAAATLARGGFACMFSTSDEYETALITQRRAQGHYDLPKSLAYRSVRRLCADDRGYLITLELNSRSSRQCRGAARRRFLVSLGPRLATGHVTGV
jgi:hypothetical protein